MGALPNLLPGGRPVEESAARIDMAAAWNVETLPSNPGRSTNEIIEALANGTLRGAVIGGLELADLPNAQQAKAALEVADFVVSLEVRQSDVTELADVVLPVAPPSERAGAFWNWEGRVRPFGRALETSADTDHRVLSMLAGALGTPIALETIEAVRNDIDQLGNWDGQRLAAPTESNAAPVAVGSGQAILATWHQLIDAGALQIAERYLAGTAKTPVARISQATAAANGLSASDHLTVSTQTGTITLPVAVTEMADHVVWLPLKSHGSLVYSTLGAQAGEIVSLTPAQTVASSEGNEA